MYQGAYEIVLPGGICQSSLDAAVSILEVVREECPQDYKTLRAMAHRCWKRMMGKREKLLLLSRRMERDALFWENKLADVAAMRKDGLFLEAAGEDSGESDRISAAMSELQQNMARKRDGYLALIGGLSPEQAQAAADEITKMNLLIAGTWAEECNLRCFPIVSAVTVSLEKWIVEPCVDKFIRDQIEYEDLELPEPPVPSLRGESQSSYLKRAADYRGEFMRAIDGYAGAMGCELARVPARRNHADRDPDRHYKWLVRHIVLGRDYLCIAMEPGEDEQEVDEATVRRAVRKIAAQIGLNASGKGDAGRKA